MKHIHRPYRDDSIMREEETTMSKMSKMSRLYSDDPAVREKEAAKYRVFHKKVRIPRKWRKEWDELLGDRNVNAGSAWPDSLKRLLRTRKWPEYTFGTANASCLVVLHRPGDPKANSVEDTFISPNLPVLGGIPHAHNAFWYPNYNTNPTYSSLHRYIKPTFARLDNPWSQVMTTNLTPIPAPTGRVDAEANLNAVNSGQLDFLVSLCQPRIILLCGGKVHEAVARGNWNAPLNVEVLKCDHPSYPYWDPWSRDGDKVKDIIERVLFS